MLIHSRERLLKLKKRRSYVSRKCKYFEKGILRIVILIRMLLLEEKGE